MKAIAIDDEPMALEVIRVLAEKVPFLEMQQFFTNAFEALDFLRKNKVDLLFLDIKMPDIAGTDLIQTMAEPPMVIFTTAYSEHAVKSFELNAIDYLLKPFSLPRFLKACNKAHDQLQFRNGKFTSGPRTLFIKSGYEQVRVNLDDVLYAESRGNYVQIITSTQKVMSRLTMSEVEELLLPGEFIRVHRSFIIAKKHITKVERRTVWVNHVEIPVGSAFAQHIENFFKNPNS